jgi:hypothetical protein
LFSGAWNEAGIQATELLAAVHRVPFGVRIEKEAEVGLAPEEPPVRSSFASAFVFWSSGIGAPIFITVGICGSVRRDLPGTSVLRLDVHLGGRGTAGSRDGLAVITTAGVACTPKLCAALRLKTCEVWPDARCGPVRGKAANGFVRLARRRYQRTMGAWCRWVRFPSGFRLGGQATETLVLP